MYDSFKNSVLGFGLDIDGAFGRQCVDPILAYGSALFPGVHWSVLFNTPVGSAKNMFDKANEKYWVKVLNDHKNANQLPPRGAIVVFAASPEQGYTSTFSNIDGTVGIVDSADSKYIYHLHQDSSEARPTVRLKQRAWRYTRCIGWLIPRAQVVPTPAPTLGDSRIGRTLYLHGVPSWRVYRVGDEPVRKNTYNFIYPGRFREGPGGQLGLQYRIEGVSKYPNCVTIRTESYGLVDIFLDKDAEIL
jgi:hypothetical protein